MRQQILDHFGELLVRSVRDRTLEHWDLILIGHMKSARSRRIYEIISGLDPSAADAVHWLLPQVVDLALDNLMDMLEEERSIKLSVRVGETVIPSIRDISDGLAGELYGEEGWIRRFSKYPHVDPAG